MTEFELLRKSKYVDLSMTFEERNHFKTELKDIILSSVKLFSCSCKLEINLSRRNKLP